MPEQTPTPPKEEKVHGWYISPSGFDIESYLNKRIHGQLEYFNSKSSSEKTKYFNYQWTLIICSSLTPILVSVSESSIINRDGWLHNAIYIITLATSFIVSVLAAALKTFKYQENWTTTRAVCEMINREKFLYEACVGDYSDKKRRDALFVERIEGLLAREQNQWLGTANASKEGVRDEDGDGDIDDNDVKLAKKAKTKELKGGSENEEEK
jgi:hypothetical protein